ncbi:MAG: TldD/PmbA family protein [Myxococcota bacterium]
MADAEEAQLLDTAAQVAERARSAGADVAEVLARTSRDLSVKVRLGAPELVEEAGSSAVGLRVVREGRSATTSTSDLSPDGLSRLIEDALEMAELAEPDPISDLPDPADRVVDPPSLDLYDPSLETFDGAEARALALEAEDAARGLDPRITNSNGATVSRTVGTMALATGDGFAQAYRNSYLSLVVQPLADDADGKKRVGFHWDARRHREALASPADVGQEAARRTLAKLGADKIPTCELPVVFSPDAGRALLALLCSCVGGAAVYKRQSYLADLEAEPIADERVHIVDDALLPRGPASRPFDGEGLPSRRTEVVSGGVLKTFLLDTYSARKLSRASTGSASRGVGSRPSPGATNFHLLPGDADPESMVKELERGLYVTSMMGFGFNAVTGDFSRGAEGFLIENGEKTQPVGEITISLGFTDLWRRIDALGDDLDPKTGLATPTFRVSRMTVAGT